jgi:hypothetical protein
VLPTLAKTPALIAACAAVLLSSSAQTPQTGERTTRIAALAGAAETLREAAGRAAACRASLGDTGSIH